MRRRESNSRRMIGLTATIAQPSSTQSFLIEWARLPVLSANRSPVHDASQKVILEIVSLMQERSKSLHSRKRRDGSNVTTVKRWSSSHMVAITWTALVEPSGVTFVGKYGRLVAVYSLSKLRRVNPLKSQMSWWHKHGNSHNLSYRNGQNLGTYAMK